MFRMTLNSIRTGREKVPDRVLLYGVEGVGKTSFAADCPGVVFLAAEDGVSHLDVPRFPEPESFGDVLSAIDTLTREQHDFRALAIDTLDWIEPLVWREVCQQNGFANIEAPGYGKGYALTADPWRKILSALETMQAKTDMDVIMLAHCQIKPFSNPNGQDFSRYEIKLHRIGAALCKEWTRANLFATHEEFARKRDGEMKVKGVSTGRRVIYTTRTAAYDAKNRCNLPAELPLSWAEYAAARDAGIPSDPGKLASEATELLATLRCDDVKRQQITEAITKNQNNPAQLARVVDRLRSLVAEQEREAA